MKILIPTTVAAKRLGIPTKLLSNLHSCDELRVSTSNCELEDQDYYYAQGLERLLEDKRYREELKMNMPGWHLTNPFSSEPIWIEVKEYPGFELDDVD